MGPSPLRSVVGVEEEGNKGGKRKREAETKAEVVGEGERGGKRRKG